MITRGGISGKRYAKSGERAVALGAVYATLDRLERKGFVTSRLGEGTPERAGTKRSLVISRSCVRSAA